MITHTETGSLSQTINKNSVLTFSDRCIMFVSLAKRQKESITYLWSPFGLSARVCVPGCQVVATGLFVSVSMASCCCRNTFPQLQVIKRQYQTLASGPNMARCWVIFGPEVIQNHFSTWSARMIEQMYQKHNKSQNALFVWHCKIQF